MELGSKTLVGNWSRGKRSLSLVREGREKASLRLMEAGKELIELPCDDFYFFSMKQESRDI